MTGSWGPPRQGYRLGRWVGATLLSTSVSLEDMSRGCRPAGLAWCSPSSRKGRQRLLHPGHREAPGPQGHSVGGLQAAEPVPSCHAKGPLRQCAVE